jgi:hypothetical protein
MKKVTKKELETLQGLVSRINQGTFNVGNVELQKKNMIDELHGLIAQLEAEKQVLQKKYGDKEINVMTGEIIDVSNASN